MQINFYFVYLCHAARLAGGSNHSEGRVEIKVGEQWQTVCGLGFDDIDANIVCNQMGYGEVLSTSLGNDRYGIATGTALVKNVNCNSNFQLMYQCASEVVPDGDPQCTSDNDVGIVCSNSGERNAFPGPIIPCSLFWNNLKQQTEYTRGTIV